MSDTIMETPATDREDDFSFAGRAIGLLDLTNLDEGCTDSDVEELCIRARGNALIPPVAAVCVWPRFVLQANGLLAGSGVRIATVVNFPVGTDSLEQIIADVENASRDGADEIDLVLPYERFLAGDLGHCSEVMTSVQIRMRNDQILKVILETGVLADPVLIAKASEFTIYEGADFIKTSTGKTPVSATPKAIGIMLEAIRKWGGECGIKPSGGIRTIEQARLFVSLADDIMGDGSSPWVNPRTFRFGASGLHTALCDILSGSVPVPLDAEEAPAPTY